MKIAYISSVCFADTDIPLIREYQRMGHDVSYFMLLPCYLLRSTIVDIRKQDPRSDILPASVYPELELFSKYLDISKFFVINRSKHSEFHPSTLALAFKLNKHLEELNPDIIHITEPFSEYAVWLYAKWKKKMVLTVHDPFPHSGENNFRSSVTRKLAFRTLKKFVLLNAVQRQQFIDTYHINESDILVNSFGEFDFLKLFRNQSTNHPHNILFFGRISPYKGLEYLCQAMLKVRKKVRDATLTIAGGGQIYFDIKSYEDKSYIEIHNHYVGVQELVNFIDSCGVIVCPYTDATQSGVIVTSYSLGKPVVASDVGGLSEMVEDGLTGMLVPPRDSDALADALITILSDDVKRKSMEERINSEYFRNERSWSAIAMKYIEFYSK